MKAGAEKSNQENKSKRAADNIFQKRNKQPAALAFELPGIEADRPGLEHVIQRAGLEPGSLNSQEVLQLHSTLGNQAVGRLLTGPIQKKENENKTGMPDQLKSGIEQLSGLDMSDVQVHYNSSQPARLHALAYTQGTEIHVAPGQERHLPHEAWHVVQQKQNRVRPTMQMRDTAINDDPVLENEADVKGGYGIIHQSPNSNNVAQKKSGGENPFRFVDNRPGVVKQSRNQVQSNRDFKFGNVAQCEPAAQGYRGPDEDFIQKAIGFAILPSVVMMGEEDGGTLFIMDFPNFECQIHIHEALDGEITSAHIKSYIGNIRHEMRVFDAVLYLDNLNALFNQQMLPLEPL